MKKLLTILIILLQLSAIGQDYLTVPSSNPSLFETAWTVNSDKAHIEKDTFIYLYDTISLPFKDDFTRNHLRKLNAKISDANVKDTLFYYLLIGNQVVDTNARFTEAITNLYRFNADSTAIDTIPLTAVSLTINNLKTYPIRNEVRQVYPAYNIYDTLGRPLDTIATVFDYKQDSIQKYIVAPFGNPLWQEDYVYINDGYAVNQPSYGVATFDGLDRDGRPYDNSSTSTYGRADQLTSVPIDLSARLASDSIYLSFFYQGKGLSRDGPEDKDSLVLEFYNSTTQKWVLKWASRGKTMTNFEQILVYVGSDFLTKAFQFRFRNKANLSGAWDNWNLDYVLLDRNRSFDDTIYNDIAIKRNSRSMLPVYSSIPYWQYDVLSTQDSILKDTISYTFGNNLNSQKTILFRYFVSDPTGNYYPQFPYPSGSSTSTILQGGDTQKRVFDFNQAPVNFTYPSVDMDTANTFITTYVAQWNDAPLKDLFPENDTLYHEQRFDHYLAYDDGSAEAGYGVNLNDTTMGKRGIVFQKFSNLILNDTINAVSIYFLPQGDNMEGSTFTISVWKELNSSGLLFKKKMKSQIYYAAQNGFITYHLDTSLILSDRDFYIGIEQNTFKSLNIGYDFSNNQKNKVFYTLNGVNFLPAGPAIQPGNLMIRPYFRVNKFEVGEKELTDKSTFDFKMYPNPSKGLVRLEFNNNEYTTYTVQVYDIQGKMLQIEHVSQSKSFDFSYLNRGIYFVRIVDENGRTATRKLIISH